jgi:hypothetical protein
VIGSDTQLFLATSALGFLGKTEAVHDATNARGSNSFVMMATLEEGSLSEGRKGTRKANKSQTITRERTTEMIAKYENKAQNRRRNEGGRAWTVIK